MSNRDIEMLITSDSDRKTFLKILKFLKNKKGVSFTEDVSDTNYFEYVDTIYIDFNYKEHCYTLHLEHYTGIYFLTKESKVEVVNIINEFISEVTNILGT